MPCYFASDALVLETTPVDNLFLIEHLPRANGPQLQVYLYGLMLCRYPALEQDIADALTLTDEEVLEAFCYWQREGLVTIRAADPLRVEYAAPGARPAQPLLIPGKYNSLVQAIQSILAPRMLTASELRRVYDWVEVFHLEESAVLELVSYCYERKGARVSLRYMEAVAQGWADAGVCTVQDARAQIAAHEALSSGAMEILQRWNKGRRPTRDEVELYERWTKEWGFTPEAVQAAVAAAVSADRPTFAYLNGVLERLRAEGLTTEEAIRAQVTRDAQDSQRARQVFQRMGAKRAANAAQTAAIRGYSEAGIPMEVMLYAAERAAEKERAYSYFKRIMDGYRDAGVHTLEEAKKQAEPPVSAKAKSDFTDYPQRRYSEEDLKHIYIQLDE